MKSLFDFDEAFGRNIYDGEMNGITPLKIKVRTRIKFEDKTKRQNVQKLITELPEPGESIHIVSNGSFDYFTVIPHIIELAGEKVTDFWFSTCTLSLMNVTAMLDLYDRDVFANINALTGDYIKSRESNVYNLLTECKKRGQRIASNKNHSKVTLLEIGTDMFIIEGSANFTANPRIEQFILSNHVGLFHFHRSWMDKILTKYAQ